MNKEDREWLDQLIEENKESDNELTYTYCPFSVLYVLQKENKELHNKIDKAIEYIGCTFCCIHDEELLNDLLEILKDSDVDE